MPNFAPIIPQSHSVGMSEDPHAFMSRCQSIVCNYCSFLVRMLLFIQQICCKYLVKCYRSQVPCINQDFGRLAFNIKILFTSIGLMLIQFAFNNCIKTLVGKIINKVMWQVSYGWRLWLGCVRNKLICGWSANWICVCIYASCIRQ